MNPEPESGKTTPHAASSRAAHVRPGQSAHAPTGTSSAFQKHVRDEPSPIHAPAGTASTSAFAKHAPAKTGQVVLALLRKELLVELRTLESVPGMSLFAVSTFVVFHFALQRATVDGDLAAGVLWVTLLFAAMLGLNRLFVADAEQGGFDGFLLAPVDRSALLLAKALALLAYLLVLELVALPAFALLLAPQLGHALPGLLAVLALADVGLAIIGTLIAALAVRTRARDLLGPLLTLPLLVPIVIGAARASAPLLSAGHAGTPGARWLLLLALYDLVFGLIAYAVFDFLLED
jgi:heme exporter protein B